MKDLLGATPVGGAAALSASTSRGARVADSTPCLDQLLEAVGVSNPWADEDGMPSNACPEGWTGVWDENGGYIAYFQHEEDAYAFRLFLITTRQQGKKIAGRYLLGKTTP